METMAILSPTRALSSESSTDAVDTFDHVASMSSTPPTSINDSMSMTSEAPKQEVTVVSEPIDDHVAAGRVDSDATVSAGPGPSEVEEPVTSDLPLAIAAPDTPVATPSAPADDAPSTARSRRSLKNVPVYNLAKLSGTAIHGKRRANGDIVADRKRRVTSDGIIGRRNNGDAESALEDAKEAGTGSLPNSPKARVPKKRALSPEPAAKRSTRSTGPMVVENVVKKISTLGKRSKKSIEGGFTKMSREMRRLRDTNEFAGIDTKPVLYTTWSKGKYVDPNARQPPRKKVKVSAASKKKSAEEDAATAAPEELVVKQRPVKKWLTHGLYSGQDAPLDVTKHLTPSEKKALADLPELMPSAKVNKVLPMPMYNGLRALIQGKDYKLPFDICNPLPSGQPKPASFKLMTKNRFIGEAGAIWKKTPHFKDYQSKCVCTPEDGCGESCQNRIMLYECDTTNCNAGVANCQNRAFARLQERIKAGGKYRVGVEVFKTENRGFGIRSNRCFQPGQIIMEYTGEIITEEESERRMEMKYKDNECYYLMSFDQNMIIDATTGSIARFVNHSCQPNSRMIKWIVGGQPRMALFAGDRPIMTGEELTYDYNFDPFSSKNVQKCLCGSPNCRGVLGPKPKEIKPPKPSKEELKKAKKGAKGTKRKFKDALGGSADAGGSQAKKRKIKAATGTKGVKRTVSKASAKAVKGAAKVVKKTVSSISVKTPSSGGKLASIKRKSSVVKTYSKNRAAAAARLSAGTKKTAGKTGAAAAKGTKGKPGPKPGAKAAAKVAKAIKGIKGTKSTKSTKGTATKARGNKKATASSAGQDSGQIHVAQPPAGSSD